MEIISVNYNTPDLIDNLITSIKAVTNLPIRIIDGSDREYTMLNAKEVCAKHQVEINQLGYNIHHGRGMDYAMNTSKHDWVLIIDSDSMIKPGLLEALLYDKPYCGFGMQVDRNGSNTSTGILYLHPHFLLVNASHYHQHSAKFIHHGAPAIEVMMNTSDNDKNVISEDYQQYFIRGGRGTVSRFGYQF